MNRNQKSFLNPAAGLAGIKTGLANKNFWPDVTEEARNKSAKTIGCPKSDHYREHLAPYLHKRVQIVSTTGWSIVETIGNTTRLCLNDAMLIFAGKHKRQEAEKLRLPTGHMHISVDNTWLRFVDPQPDEDLLVNGVFYEYVNAQGFRNIAILPVIVTPIANHHKTYKNKKTKRGNRGDKSSQK